MKLSGVISVLPGSISTFSRPSPSMIGHSRSANWQAMNSVPSDTIGAARLAPNASAKWPMNIYWAGTLLSNAVLEHQADRGVALEALPRAVFALATEIEIRLLVGLALEIHAEV